MSVEDSEKKPILNYILMSLFISILITGFIVIILFVLFPKVFKILASSSFVIFNSTNFCKTNIISFYQYFGTFYVYLLFSYN